VRNGEEREGIVRRKDKKKFIVKKKEATILFSAHNRTKHTKRTYVTQYVRYTVRTLISLPLLVVVYSLGPQAEASTPSPSAHNSTKHTKRTYVTQYVRNTVRTLISLPLTLTLIGFFCPF
jgi:hypothetical protein